MHANVASAHPVRTSRVEIGLWVGLSVCLAVVAIMNMATMDAAVPIILAGAVRCLLVELYLLYQSGLQKLNRRRPSIYG